MSDDIVIHHITAPLAQVCKQWTGVIDEFLTLQYLVWFGIHGRQIPGPGVPSDTISERLEKLHHNGRRWEELQFFWRDAVEDRVTLQGSGCSAARVGNESCHHLLLCTMPSREDNAPPKILGPIPLAPNHTNIQALDLLTDVLLHYQGKSPTIICFRIIKCPALNSHFQCCGGPFGIQIPPHITHRLQKNPHLHRSDRCLDKCFQIKSKW